MIDLLAVAKANRYRVRNLADGRPLEPVTGRGDGERLSAGYVGLGEREDVVVGRFGYVTVKDVPTGLVGVHVMAASGFGLTNRLKQLVAAGWIQKQRGDREAFGYLDESKLEAALRAIRVSRLSPGNANPNTSGLRRGPAVGT